MDASTLSDLDDIIEKMLTGKYNVYKRGETYDRVKPQRFDVDRGTGIEYIDNSPTCKDAEIYPSVRDRTVYDK